MEPATQEHEGEGDGEPDTALSVRRAVLHAIKDDACAVHGVLATVPPSRWRRACSRAVQAIADTADRALKSSGAWCVPVRPREFRAVLTSVTSARKQASNLRTWQSRHVEIGRRLTAIERRVMPFLQLDLFTQGDK